MLQVECRDLQKKLEENQKHLDSNDQMIRWLNNQVRDLLFQNSILDAVWARIYSQVQGHSAISFT